MKNRSDAASLSTPDLVLLSLLAECPMHGYEANAELERRQVRDWAGISRAQIYYSFDKLKANGLLASAHASTAPAGPEKRVLRTTAKGRTKLAEALAREDWTHQRERPPFLTWLALSWQASPKVVAEQFARRSEFLRAEIVREETTLAGVVAEVGHRHHEAIWMLELVLDHLRSELAWAKRVMAELPLRKPAKKPSTR
jgi:DNA-binding PadR family transcriptional regulator